MEVVEEFIKGNMDDLIKECAHLCKDVSDVYGTLTLQEGVVYEGCESCIISTALDHLNLPSITIRTLSGELIEFTKVNDYVFEVTNSSVTIHTVNSLKDYLSDLVEFGIIDDESLKIISRWLIGEGNPSK